MKVFMHACIVVSMVLLPGCGGVVDWANETFDQGKQHADHKATVDKYMRSIKIYDQFETVALFDILFLSDDIRDAYSKLFSSMHGRSQEAHLTFLRRQLKTNEHFVSFYVLSTHQVPLNLKPAVWSIYLKIGDVAYQPLEIKAIELSPEYNRFFGKRLTNHKRPYEIRFERQDTEGRDILEGVSRIELVCSTPKYHSAVAWDLPKEESATSAPEMDSQEQIS